MTEGPRPVDSVDGSPLRVLVVDDEPLVAAGHAQYVARVPGFVVVGTVGTAQEAVRFLRDQAVDLVLLDLNLPDGHGLDIVRAVRGAGRPLDILPITAAREAHLVRTAVSLGVVGYLLKPFSFADLRDRLRAYHRYRSDLAAAPSANQGQVDAMLSDLHQPAISGAIPQKGLSAPLMDQVIDTLRRTPHPEGLSASEVAEAIGSSRVTARRYLQQLVDTGAATRGQRLGGSGRPEVTFRWRLSPS